MKTINGIIRVIGRGIGFIEDQSGEEIKIENQNLNTALHGDHVRVKIKYIRGEKSGIVTEILTRTKINFVGVVQKVGDTYIVDPQDRRMYTSFIIPDAYRNEAVIGEKVFVNLKEWNSGKERPIGEIIQRIGKAGVHETEMRSIILDKGFDLTFPKHIEREAQAIKEKYPAIFNEELKKRRDLREVPTFTIDPDTAKDFDDALSIQRLPNGNFEVGIHIADVSFFIPEKSALDIEASRRGTSIYLVDRTIPMLPHILSDDICSLNENEDKLTFSIILEITATGEVRTRSFERTIIRSKKRFTYEEAQEVLDSGNGTFAEELRALDAISLELRKKRIEKGAIEFESNEVKFELDETGNPIRVYKKERIETNKLIEDFMILANNEVAYFMTKKDKNVQQTFIYRVHDVPDKDKMNELLNLLGALGYKIPRKKGEFTTRDINNILKKVAGEVHENLVQMATLQSMTKAIYSTKNTGHFGLSLKHYTHFTSPIRRYPDIMVHRLLFLYLSGKKVPKKDLGHYEALSRYSTQMEIAAAEAERASIKFKQTQFMSAHIGEIFDGVITGLIESGMFVREDKSMAEGMVRLRDLKDDYYMLDKTGFAMVGKKKKKKYLLGDKVKVKLTSVDIDKRLIDFELVE